jgi:glycosyltransferase involved in cell wall biosynthesis
MSVSSVSVVIPTRNGGATLGPLLDAIGRQRMDLPVEIVAVDSSSTDGSDTLLRRRADVFVSIPETSFNHGLTRNLAVERSGGDVVVLTVQDALPNSAECLSNLIAPLRADGGVAASFARQIPRPDAGALTKRNLERWAAASAIPRVATLSGIDEFNALTPMQRLDRCAFDNVCACIRRSVWQQYHFREVPIAEDLAWAKEVLLAGHRIAFVPDAVVVHSHDRSPQYEFERSRLLHAELCRLFGLQTIASLPSLARSIAATIADHARVEPGVRGFQLAVAWPLGQYLGARKCRAAL